MRSLPAVVLLALLVGCGPSRGLPSDGYEPLYIPPVRPTTGVVTGRVVDASAGVGLPDVLVRVQNVTPPCVASTDKDGNFAIRDVPQGQQVIVIDLEGYRAPGNHIATVLPNATTALEAIAMEAVYSSPCPAVLNHVAAVEGRVFDQGGKPVAGLATITVESLAASVPYRGTTATDDMGRFIVSQLPQGAPLRVVAQVGCGPRAIRQLTAPLCGTVQLGFGGPASPADPEAPQYFLWVEPGAPSSSPCPLPSWSGL